MSKSDENGVPVPPGSWFYLLPIWIGPLLVLGSAFFIIPSRWFALHSKNTYIANLGYGARLSNHECQVLVYGDSSALVGVDPKVIEAKTGLSTCNIAEFGGITRVSGTEPVDRYLERNSRPKYVVFLYAPELLSRPRTWKGINLFEAITYQVRQEPNAATAWALATHPEETIGWAEQGLRLAASAVGTKPFPQEQTQVRARDGGQLKISGPDRQTCRNDSNEAPPSSAWVTSLRSKYGVDGTRVIVDVTPMLDCDEELAYFRTHLVGIVDDLPVPVYPPTDYTDEHSRMHMNAKGAAKVSTMIGDQILKLQGGH